jgi:hypothetical protein
MNEQLMNDTTGLFAAKNSSYLVKKNIAENYAFQSLSNSLLFQAFNYEKMYLTKKEEPVTTFRVVDYFILSIPLLLFTLFFLIVGFEWIVKAPNSSGSPLSLRTKILRCLAILLLYGINFYSFYLWILGIRDVARIKGFGYKVVGL